MRRFALAPILLLSLSAARVEAVPRHPVTRAAAKTTPAPLDPEKINDPATRPAISRVSAGAGVLRAQILLDRARFSPAEIDGRYGDNLRVALLGYQNANNLPPTGLVDRATWEALSSDSRPALVQYEILPEDVKGPFDKLPAKLEEQATLKSLGYESPQEELGEKFHINPKLLAQLNPGKDLTQAGQQIWVPDVKRTEAARAAKVVVSKETRTVTALGADGTVLARFPATIGSVHDPLPIGDWVATTVERNPVFFYNPELFWDADPNAGKARIPPGPNNPVGVVWIGLSKPHYGIHGTPNPDRIGHSESHGCVRLTNWDALELAAMVHKGTPVLFEEN